MKRTMATMLALAMWTIPCPARIIDADDLPSPIVTDNSVEVCLNSRYSQHSLRGTASMQQISNIVWAAGRAPFTGTHRDIYVLTTSATYLYDPNGHSLTWHSNEATNDGAFAIRYESELDFDTGVSFMTALLASVSLCHSSESPVASCPKGIGYPKARLIFGVQPVSAPTTRLVARSSAAQGDPGWLPDPSTTGDNRLEDVLARLNYVSRFAQTNLTLPQISQVLWAGYGCTDHTPSGKAGLTVPSAWANYYLTRSIYLVNEDGAYRYHNRNPDTNLSTRDHRLEPLSASGARRGSPPPADARAALQAAVSGLPQAPCYVVICLDSSYAGQEYARLETGFAAGNMLLQATALDLGCHFTPTRTSAEQKSIQAATNIPASHLPRVVVSIGPMGVRVSISVILQGHGRPETGWAVPLTVRFFAPGADVLNDMPAYEFNLTTARSAAGDSAVCEATGLAPGTYDITALGPSTLINLKKSVVIAAPQTSVDLGTLLAGDVNQDGIVDLDDYAVLSTCWQSSKDQVEYHAGADFDRNGLVDAADVSRLAASWLLSSPIEIPPLVGVTKE